MKTVILKIKAAQQIKMKNNFVLYIWNFYFLKWILLLF